MRTVINISLPAQLTSVVEETMASGEYASKSEFFRSLLRMWIEGKLSWGLEQSRSELKAGRGKLLKSLKDLR